MVESAYWRLVPYEWRPAQLWYQFKCWLWIRHSTMKPRSLGHTWVDRSELLPHLMFEVLGRFLEEECSPGIVDWDAIDEHRAAMAEMKELWRWWTEDYLPFNSTEYLDEVERPEWVNLPEEKMGDLVVYPVEFRFSSPEAEQAYHEAHRQRADAEMAMFEELKARCKRLVDVMHYMWT